MVDLTPNTPLQHAIVYRDQAKVAALLADGADPNATGPVGRTALHTAAACAELEIVRMLLRGNAAVDARDAAGNTPLLVAVVATKPEVVPVIDDLLAAAANPDAANDAGATPRAFALAGRNNEIKARFAQDEQAAQAARAMPQAVPVAPPPKLPRIEITASTPSKLTLAVDGRELTFDGELVVTEDGGRERILRITDPLRYTDGTLADPALRPLLLTYLTAIHAVYE